ncbi:hypothetical protein [Arthrobacter mobilis]|uniref:Uncharacterized protein n=1 Tax=Arthrobacter mobilis TaxID=2724944 RepID=A0A7X6HFN5_9MICC|nr:hypothetical protein [Arthrobacter mobilis]NKX56284.1 hypothetical protein [Arthrobacter mobilis]
MKYLYVLLTVSIVLCCFNLVGVSAAITGGEAGLALLMLLLAVVLFILALGTARVIDKHQGEES